MSLEELSRELEKVDPTAVKLVDVQNPRRMQRALEVVLLSGRPFASFLRPLTFPVPGLVLNPVREILHERIRYRVRAMLSGGALEEVRNLGPCSAMLAKTIGLREIGDLLSGQISQSECEEKMTVATRQYAKRQRTWFRNRGRWPILTPEAAEAFEGLPSKLWFNAQSPL